MMDIKKISALIFIIVLVSCGSKEYNDVFKLSKKKKVCNIEISQIVDGKWNDKNHAQGITFLKEDPFITTSKQIIHFDCNDSKEIALRSCSNLNEGCKNGFHYGDITSNQIDLYVSFHTGDWNNYDKCNNQNFVQKFTGGIVHDSINPIQYKMDYPGQIGAIKVIGGILYIAGQHLKKECTQSLLIHSYNIADLFPMDDSDTCNLSIDQYTIGAEGRWGIQVLDALNPDVLLIGSYPCSGTLHHLYSYNIKTSKLETIGNSEWGYGFTVHNNKIFYNSENRTQRFTVYEVVKR